MPREARYGPGIGENWHDARFGPLGALQPQDVALSPDVARRMGLRYGDTFPYKGQIYRYADASYISPGRPNKNTIEFWMPPQSGPQAAPTPGTITDNPFADWFASVTGGGSFTQPSSGQVTDNPFSNPSWLPQYLQDAVSAHGSAAVGAQNPAPPNEQFSPVDNWFSNPVPSNEQFSPSDAAFQARNIPPSNEQFSPVDYWSGMNPTPSNEQFSPVDNWLSNPTPSNEQFSPMDIYSQQPLGTGGLDYEQLSPVDTYSNQISSPGEVTDNPFADPFAGATAGGAEYQPSPGEVTDNPFADPSWLPPGAVSPTQSAAAPVRPPVYDPLAEGSIGQPGGVQRIASTMVDPSTGRISTFDPTTGTYQPVSGPAGWTNRGYGAGSVYGAGSAGFGGGGFGGYGGLGGTGAPVTGHVSAGGMVDTSTPSGLSHGGFDPSSDSSPGPMESLAVAHILPEGSRQPGDMLRRHAPSDALDPTAVLYPSAWSFARGYWTPSATTTDPSLAVAMPAQADPWTVLHRSGFARAPVSSVINAASPMPTNVIPFPATLSPSDAAALLTGTHA